MNNFDPRSPYGSNAQLMTTEVTVRYDLNRILARNRVNAFLH